MAGRLTMSDQLRKQIERCPLTVNAIAVESGIPQPVLYRFATGERDLTLTTADKLVRYFDMELRKRET